MTKEANMTTASPVIEVLLRVEDVAKRCCVSDKTVRRWIHDKKLPCLLVGPTKRLRIRECDAERLICGKV